MQASFCLHNCPSPKSPSSAPDVPSSPQHQRCSGIAKDAYLLIRGALSPPQLQWHSHQLQPSMVPSSVSQVPDKRMIERCLPLHQRHPTQLQMHLTLYQKRHHSFSGTLLCIRRALTLQKVYIHARGNLLSSTCALLRPQGKRHSSQLRCTIHCISGTGIVTLRKMPTLSPGAPFSAAQVPFWC